MAGLALMVGAVLAGSSAHTSERIQAGPDGITFERTTGRGAMTGGLLVSKDSISIKPVK